MCIILTKRIKRAVQINTIHHLSSAHQSPVLILALSVIHFFLLRQRIRPISSRRPQPTRQYRQIIIVARALATLRKRLWPLMPALRPIIAEHMRATLSDGREWGERRSPQALEECGWARWLRWWLLCWLRLLLM